LSALSEKVGRGRWQINRLILGLGNPAQQWTLRFDGEKLNVGVTLPYGSEISIEGKTGG
jgi:hypothetical protein